MNDEVFECDGDRLKEEEFDRARYHPFLDHEIAGGMEKPREEESDVDLSVGRQIGTAGKPKKSVRDEPSQPSEHLTSVKSSEYRVMKIGQVFVPGAAFGATFA